MTKKLMMACMAVAAFAAFALPTAASASPVLTETGVKVEPPQLIVGTQVGNSFLTSTDGTRKQLTCSTGTMTGTLKENTGTHISGEITSATFGGTGAQAAGEPKPECTGESSFGNASVTALASTKSPWCLTSLSADKFTVSGGTCPKGGGTIKFIMVTTIAGSCEYESTSHIVGTYTTGGTSAILHVTNVAHSSGATENGFILVAGGFLCPTSGSLDMSFTLETENGHPLVIS